MSDHTNTPWKWYGDRLVASDRITVLSAYTTMYDEGEYDSGIECLDADRALIVRCVNSHDGLVEASQQLQKLSEEFVNHVRNDPYSPPRIEFVQDVRNAIARMKAALAAAQEAP